MNDLEHTEDLYITPKGVTHHKKDRSPLNRGGDFLLNFVSSCQSKIKQPVDKNCAFSFSSAVMVGIGVMPTP
jgi:hypothetical protein